MLSSADCVGEFLIISAFWMQFDFQIQGRMSFAFCNIRAFDVVDLLMARRSNIGFSLDSNKMYGKHLRHALPQQLSTVHNIVLSISVPALPCSAFAHA